MKILHRHRLAAAIGIFILFFLLLYPFYKYIFDLDAIGYLMVTKRWASGDFHNAINGMWSPLHSWLIVPFYKLGFNEITSFKFSNAIISIGVLWMLNKLLQKWSLSEMLKTCILLVSTIALLWYSFYEIAADLLVCLPFLWYLNIVCGENFFLNKGAAVFCGIAGALCYLSKSYFLPYFIFHFIFIQYYFYIQSAIENRHRFLIRNLIVGLGFFVLTSAGWIIALSLKFHEFTFGFAGVYNHKIAVLQNPAGPLLAEPMVPGSPHIWEDASLIKLGSYKDSGIGALFIKQVSVFLNQFMEMLKEFNELSAFSIAIVFSGLVFLSRNRYQLLVVFVFTMITLPAGYLFMHISIRYIWPEVFLLLVTGAYLLDSYFQFRKSSPILVSLFWVCFFGSFLIYPINGLKDGVGKDKEVFALAAEINQLKCKGRFASNDDKDIVARSTYISGNVYLQNNRNANSENEFIEELKVKKVDYYFFLYEEPLQKEAFQKTALYQWAGSRTIYSNEGMIVLSLN